MNEFSLVGLNKETITSTDINRLEELFSENVQLEELHKVRNDAKLRAVYSTKTYDDFKYGHCRCQVVNFLLILFFLSL